MKAHRLPAALLLAALACGAQAQRCRVEDVYADFLHLAEATKNQGDAARADALHRFVAEHAALYAPTAIGQSPAKELDATGLAEMAAAKAAASDFDLALQDALRTTVQQFARVLPDFRCDFTVYVAPTFGRMDGAGRLVNGHPALVLGPDVIAGYESAAQLPVFLTHELFHRYHFAMAGFSDDLAERDVLWRTLWAEGLATYASATLNPDRPLADAMLLPRDLAERASPLVPTLAAALMPKLDAVDAEVFGRFFEYGDASAQARGWPSRSGYYLGYLVAQRLAQRYSLQQLAHLKGPELRRLIGEALDALAAKK